MADFPAYTGSVLCPKCRLAYALTEYHDHGGAFVPSTTTRRDPPCSGYPSLSKIGEHLCRLCPNCGYGWVEACVSG